MSEQKIINAIMEALTEKKILKAYHMFQGGKAMQIRTDDGYYNIITKKLDIKDNFILKKLKSP